MSYTTGELKEDIQRRLHGASLNKVKSVNGAINAGARQMLLEVDPIETIVRAPIASAIYDDVYRYSSPSDLKGKKIIDLAPQVNRTTRDNFTQTSTEEFDIRKTNNYLSVEYDSGTKFIRLSKDLKTGIVVNQLDTISGNGNWSDGDDAENLTQDKINKVSGTASLRFDVDGNGTSAYIENSTFTDVDLSEHEDISSIFVWLYTPDKDAVTDVELRWGSGASDYWSNTVTSPHDRSSFKEGWNLLRFDWEDASETGTPDASAVDFLRVTLTYDGDSHKNFRVDNIISRVGEIWELTYYSNQLFRSSSGTWKEETDDSSDIINLDTESYNLLLDAVMLEIAQQVQGEDSGFDMEVYLARWEQSKKKYMRMYPSQAMKIRDTYYRIPKPNRQTYGYDNRKRYY